MKRFDLKKDDYSGGYYKSSILDIWCQNDKVVAYVQGTYIYKTEMIIKGDRIKNYYCSCPSSEGGMSFCKHLSWVKSYINENEILELEYIETKEKLKSSLSVEEVVSKFKDEINNLIDDYTGGINCYNSSNLSDITLKYGKYINRLIKKNKLDESFKITLELYNIISDVYVVCVDDHDECREDIICHLEELIDDYNYLDKTILYIESIYMNTKRKIDDAGIGILDIIVQRIDNEDISKRIIKFIRNINYDSYNEYKIASIKKEIKDRC